MPSKEQLYQTDSFKNNTDAIFSRKDYADKYQIASNESNIDSKLTKMGELYDEVASNDLPAVNFLLDMLDGKSTIGMKTPKIGEVFNDFISSKDFPAVIGPAIEIYMKNYVLPRLFVSNEIFQTVPYSGENDQVNLRSMGLTEIKEVGRGEPYPEVGPSILDKAYRMSLDIKKYGVKLGIENELWNSDNWGILGMYIASIKDSFDMHKEWMAINLLNMMGTTIYNNAAPANSIAQTITSGRDIAGAHNGTMTLNDLMYGYSWGNMRGYNYDTILMHPFAFPIFATDPEMREIVVSGATATAHMFNARHSGGAAPGFGGPFGEQWGYKMSGLGGSNPNSPNTFSINGNVDPIFGKLGISPAGNTLTPYGASFTINPPGVATPGGIKVIVSPLVPHTQDPTSKKYITNLYFVDSQKTGVILQGEGPTTDNWEDAEREIKYIKFKSKFGISPVHQGRGVAVYRNLVIDRNYVFNNVNSATLAELTGATTPTGVAFP